jgi:hypothetical protein
MLETVVPTLVRDLVRKTGRARVRATGTSMVPSIWPGDELLIQNTSAPLIPGQVVAWQANQRIFIHRVIEVNRNTVLTRGDRHHIPDPPFSPDQLLGVVTHVIRNDVPAVLSTRLSYTARLLRFISRLSDWPAFLLVIARAQRRSSRPSLVPR